MVDYSVVELDQKRDQLLNHYDGNDIKYKFNIFELTEQMSLINEQYKYQIENQPVL